MRQQHKAQGVLGSTEQPSCYFGPFCKLTKKKNKALTAGHPLPGSMYVFQDHQATDLQGKVNRTPGLS